MASELLTTFAEELNGILLKPAETAGEFRILVDGELLMDRKSDSGFPEITALKRQVRDRIAPHKSLGHLDRAHDGADLKKDKK